MKSWFTILVVTVFLAGCGAKSLVDMKENAAIMSSVTVNEDSQSVFTRAEDEFTRCLEITEKDQDILADFQDDPFEGDIYQTVHGNMLFLVQLKELGEHQTEVVYWVFYQRDQPLIPRFEAFFLEGTPLCPE